MFLLQKGEVLNVRHSRWCQLVIVIAIAGLTCSLATRTFRLKAQSDVVIKSADREAMHQHLDGDAVRWTPPFRISVILQTPTFYPDVAPAGPTMPGLFLDESSLYNRPPPSSC
jgi:hypothetical protein